MAHNYTSCNRDQLYLLPPDMKDWLAADHLVWFLIDAVEQMDLSAFHAAHRADGRGQKAHHPALMLVVLLYAYCQGERSSRKIERACQESVPYRILAANTTPDHCAFSRFRQRHATAMQDFFVQVLRLCAAAGLLSVGKVSLDGTKMKADASLDANHSEASLARKIEQILAEAEAKDGEEDTLFGPDQRGDELPEALRSPSSRLARLQAAKDRLAGEREAAEEAQRQKLSARVQQEESTGKKPRGRTPKSVAEVGKEQEKRQANATAPETRILKTRSGYVQGFNAQAVCTDGQMILAPAVVIQENDQGLLHLLAEQAQANTTAVLGEVNGQIALVRADAGYCNDADLAQACSYELLVATTKGWKQRQELSKQGPPRGRIPKGLSAVERMERKQRTQRGQAEYKKRAIIEGVFGQIKSGRGIHSFYGRELVSAQGEWNLICGTHNLLKLFVKQQQSRN